MANIIALPYEYFANPTKSGPLFNAQIYIGVVDTDPLIPANRVDVFYVQEDNTQVILPQPIRTNSGGFTVNGAGEVVQIRTANAYSMRIFDRNGAEITQYNIPNNTESGGATISFVNQRIAENASFFDSVADMIASSVLTTAGMTAVTRGYNEAGDGGGATYLMTAGNTGNGFGDHNVGALTASIQILSNVIHLKQFGLLMDGATEQTIRLQAAINHISEPTVTGEGLVYTNATIEVPSGASFKGPWGITTGAGNCNHNGFNLNQVTSVLMEDTIIEGVDGEDGFDTAIIIISSTNVTLSRVKINNIGQFRDTPNERGQGMLIRPIAFDAGTDFNNDINISNCRITNIKGNGNQRGDFIEIRRTRNINVSNCYFKGSNRMGIAITNQVSGCIISGNHILDAGLASIDIESNEQNFDAKDIIIDGNYINNWGAQTTPFPVGVQQYGIDMHPTSNRVVISNNNFDSFNNPNARGFIYAINSAREYLILGNTFSGATTVNCLRLREGGGTNRILVDNNTFRFTTQDIFELFACRDVVIKSCIVDAQSPRVFVRMQDGGRLTVRDCEIEHVETGIIVGASGSSQTNPNVFIDNVRMTRVTGLAVNINFTGSSTLSKLNITNVDATSEGTPTASGAFSVVGDVFENSNFLNNIASGWTRIWDFSSFEMSNYRVIFSDTTPGTFIGQTAFIATDNQLAQWDGTVWSKP